MSTEIAIVTAHNSYFITKLLTINNSVMSTHRLNRPNYYSLDTRQFKIVLSINYTANHSTHIG